MGIYVSFNDSFNDPTYSSADNVTLVSSSSDDFSHNPCVDFEEQVSVLPNDLNELKVFARMQGWDIHYDANGQAILHTGIRK